jgi:hypothetical protein
MIRLVDCLSEFYDASCAWLHPPILGVVEHSLHSGYRAGIRRVDSGEPAGTTRHDSSRTNDAQVLAEHHLPTNTRQISESRDL